MPAPGPRGDDGAAAGGWSLLLPELHMETGLNCLTRKLTLVRRRSDALTSPFACATLPQTLWLCLLLSRRWTASDAYIGMHPCSFHL